MRIGLYQIDWLRLPPSQWQWAFQRATGLAMCYRHWSLLLGPIALQKRITR